MFLYGLVAGPHSLVDTIIVASRYVMIIEPTIFNVITGRICTNGIGSTKYVGFQSLCRVSKFSYITELRDCVLRVYFFILCLLYNIHSFH